MVCNHSIFYAKVNFFFFALPGDWGQGYLCPLERAIWTSLDSDSLPEPLPTSPPMTGSTLSFSLVLLGSWPCPDQVRTGVDRTLRLGSPA